MTRQTTRRRPPIELHEATTFEALWAAWRRTSRGKRRTPEMDRFEFHLERNLLELSAALRARAWEPGMWRSVEVRDPKPRQITIAPFRDRVVHQALMAAAAPALDGLLRREVFSNRRGYGTHRAIRAYQSMAQRGRFVLKLDIASFFATIDRRVLADQLSRWSPPSWPRREINLVLAACPRGGAGPRWFPGDDLLTPAQRPCGLPLGNLVSQTMANLHLCGVDAALRHSPGTVGFLRYVDDIIVVAAERAPLRDAQALVARRLADLRLRLNLKKCGVHRVSHGISLLGYVVGPTWCRLPGRAKRRFERRFRQVRAQWQAGTLSTAEVRARLMAWRGHAIHGMSDAALTRFFGRAAVLYR